MHDLGQCRTKLMIAAVLSLFFLPVNGASAQTPTHSSPICGIQRDDNRPNACGGGATVGVSACYLSPTDPKEATYVSCTGATQTVTIKGGDELTATCIDYHNAACVSGGQTLVPRYVGARVVSTGRITRAVKMKVTPQVSIFDVFRQPFKVSPAN